MIKIGILAPVSSYIPFLATDIPDAVKSGLTENSNIEYELCVETCGNNSSLHALSRAIQNLLAIHRVDVVTAPVNVGLFSRIMPYFTSQKTPLIVNTLGEDVTFLRDQNPYLFVNSFNLWQSAWMSGYWGAMEYGKEACSICAYHDGGYGVSFAFAIGLEAQNGRLLQTTVTHKESHSDDPSELIKTIADNNPDFIMGFYSGREAASFLNAYEALGYKGQIPLICSPFAVDGSLLEELGDTALNIKTVYGWSQDTEEHFKFSKAFEETTGHIVNCYVAMAYETGGLIAKAMRQIGNEKHINKHLPEALKAVKFEGPRGVIKFDPENRETAQTSDYLREVCKDEDGKPYNKIIKVLETPPLFYEQLNLARKNLDKSGWLNPYLIA